MSTLLVNNPLDAAVANELSLRQAVVAADTDAAAGISDTIVIDPSLGGASISLSQGPLELSGTSSATITIDGSSPSMPLTIDGGRNTGAGRIFEVDSGVQVVIQDLNLQNGFAANTAIGGGGAILNEGTLSVSNVSLTGNASSYGPAAPSKTWARSR